MKTQYRFHLLGLPYLPCDKKYSACAFTQKNYKLAKMLLDLGHKVIYYGAEGSTVPCTEFVETNTLEDIRADYGEGLPNEIGYDIALRDVRVDYNDENLKPSTHKFRAKCISTINSMKQPDDFLLVTMGVYHRPITVETRLPLTIEPGVGYRGSYCRFRAFESHFLRAYMQGAENGSKDIDGSHYDRVIPNYFDAEDFDFSAEKEDYVLYLGRLVWRKGVIIAYLAAKAAGVPLVIAGPGGAVLNGGTFKSLKEQRLEFPAGGWSYVGMVGIDERRRLLSKARAVLTPTIYMEPFCGVHIEAMLSGTPPITTDFGCFPGTIPDHVNGKVGFRCNTLNDFVAAIRFSKNVDHADVRAYAERFLVENVKWDFQKWFEDLYRVYLCEANVKGEYGWNHVTTESEVVVR